MKRLALLLAALLALIAAPLAAEPQFPALSGQVVDAADILPPEAEAAIAAKLEALEAQSQRQLVVATVPDLQGYEISDYGYQLGRAWGLGDKDRDDGAILLVAPNDRKVRIEVGRGLEASVRDEEAAALIRNAILPKLRERDFEAGVEAGVEVLAREVTPIPMTEAA